MKQINRYGITAVAGIALLPALIQAVPGSAHAANDTPDGYWQTVRGGWVGWNDYANDDHSVDIDDLYVQDELLDPWSLKLTVYWRGKTYSAHAYGGETKKINIGNVPNGEKVYWKVCQWDEGTEYWCSKKYYFRE